MQDDPIYSRFFRMLRVGVPQSVSSPVIFQMPDKDQVDFHDLIKQGMM